MKRSVIDYRIGEMVTRKCPICTSGESQLIGETDEIRMGYNNDYHLYEKICVCSQCGFVFSTPTATQEAFNEYYNDQITYYNADETYSVDSRIQLIKKYLGHDDIFAEIGGNQQGLFRSMIEEYGKEYISYDINKNANNTIINVNEMKTVDVIASYYVLEHVVDLEGFIEQWNSFLKDDGCFIIEVPDASFYYSDTSSLSLTEHVNHFTPITLTMLMARYGLQLVEISKKYSSTSFGFVGVYKKTNKAGYNMGEIQYRVNKCIIEEGLAIVMEDKDNLQSTVTNIVNFASWGGVVLWCASNMLQTIYAECLNIVTHFDVTVIDEDPRKKEFNLNYKVISSKEAKSKGVFEKKKYLVICSEERIDSILKTLDEYEVVNMCMYYVDKHCKLKKI